MGADAWNAMRVMPDIDMAIVDWIDSSLQNGQVDKDAFPEPELIRSLGWLVHEEDAHIVLARDDMNDGDWRGLLCIPRECIKEVRPVRWSYRLSPSPSSRVSSTENNQP